MLTVLLIIASIFVLLCFFALVKKPGSIYKNEPNQQNPLEGKKVVFVENPSEPMNADGVCGHLEAVGDSKPRGGFYNTVIKRFLDLVLSFCGLVILSPLFLFLILWIVIDDPGPVLFTQKRIGKNKRYFLEYKRETITLCA